MDIMWASYSICFLDFRKGTDFCNDLLELVTKYFQSYKYL